MIRRELSIFLVVGVTTVLIDFTTYRGLVWAGLGVDVAKACGFLTGTVFAYVANKLWTFGHKQHAPGSAWRFVLLYGATLGANVLVNAVALRSLADTRFSVQIAFLLATATSATLNFLGMKFFVFKTATQAT
jgi:putative flippase GtrA